MANPTTSFGWVMPTSSSLVTNLPADFNTFGQAVDTSMQYLLGGTTGQVLSKTSATNMAFTWVTPTDETPLTTKGDLFTFTTVDARLAVGNNGESIYADSAASTGLRYSANFAAGKNKVINGAFDIWQRGTSGFGSGGVPNADRFFFYGDGTGVTRAISQQTFTPGTAPVSGYEGQYYFRYNQSVAGTGGTLNRFYTKLEDVRTFAGQTVTLSFWAKADAARTLTAAVSQNFGSGGSGSVATSFVGSASATTSWTRFSFTLAIPSISGKTIGTSSYLEVDIDFPLNVVETIDIWGVQVEGGSVATAFQTATGTLQGETSACLRYFWRNTVTTTSSPVGTGICSSTTNVAAVPIILPVTMRTAPTFSFTGTPRAYDGTTAASITAVASYGSNTNGVYADFTSSGLIAGRPGCVIPPSSGSVIYDYSAEL